MRFNPGKSGGTFGGIFLKSGGTFSNVDSGQQLGLCRVSSKGRGRLASSSGQACAAVLKASFEFRQLHIYGNSLKVLSLHAIDIWRGDSGDSGDTAQTGALRVPTLSPLPQKSGDKSFFMHISGHLIREYP